MATEEQLYRSIHDLFSRDDLHFPEMPEQPSWWKLPEKDYMDKAQAKMNCLTALQMNLESALTPSDEIKIEGRESSPEIEKRREQKRQKMQWLAEPNSLLGGKTPAEMLAGSEQDRETLLAAITAIQQGGFK